jgi:glycosyltransferase involved in cell wall biosynthesis
MTEPPPAGSRGRLLVVAGEPLSTLLAKGFSVEYLNRYYNPAGLFAEVGMLNVFQEQPLAGLKHAFVQVPSSAALDAWRDSSRNPWQYESLDGVELRRFYPGLPEGWIAAARDFKADCIRGYDPGWPGLLAVELADALDVPALVSVHNQMGICGEVLKRAACVLVNSESVAERSIALGADPARVVTVHDRIDCAVFTPDGEVAPGGQGSPRLLSIAREHEQKNLDRMLQACALAAKSLPGLRLVHFGKSHRDWSKWPFVTHRDSVPNTELPAWYRWADALLLPSLSEGFGIVLAEALACGTPCITSNRPAMNEIVTDRWDGLLVDPENVEDIARAIRQIADPSLQARLAAPARTAGIRFDQGVIEAREAGVYDCELPRDWQLLSVVLPTYKRGHLIEAAVRNVLAQDYPNFELIVVNDGSPDNTREVLHRLDAELQDPRLRVIHRENGGLPTALNTGFAVANGDFWTWTSDDNAYRPGALRAMARELLLDTSAGLVYADMLIRDEKGHERAFVCGPPERLEEGSCVGGCFLYRAALGRQVGDYDAGYTLAEDYDYWLRMHRIARFAWLRRELYDYADAPHSLTRRRFREMQAVQLKLFEREQGGRDDWRQRKFWHLLRHAAASKNYGLPAASVASALGAIRQRPGSPLGWWALGRALTPMPLLKLSRRLRGLDVD